MKNIIIKLLCLIVLFSCQSQKLQLGSSTLAVDIWEDIPGTSPLSEEVLIALKIKPDTKITTKGLLIEDIDKDNYVARVKAYLVPKKSGEYQFRFGSSDDGANLYLSKDSSPKNKKSILSIESWTESTPSEETKAYKLTKGERYYVELILKEGVGGDYVYVEWKEKSDADFSQVNSVYSIK